MNDEFYTANEYCSNCNEWESVEIPKGIQRMDFKSDCSNCGQSRRRSVSHKLRVNATAHSKITWRGGGMSGAFWRS